MYLEQLKERYRDLMDRQSRMGRLAIRVSFLALIALFLSTVVPTMAQDLGSPSTTQVDPAAPTGPAEPTPGDTATAEATPSAAPTIAPTDTPTPVVLPAPLSESATVKDSTTVKPDPVHALKIQPAYTSHAPGAVNVDPRAVQMNLPSIAFSGSKYTLACISSDDLRLDVLDKRYPNPSQSAALQIAGDLTGQLRISGLNDDVQSVINANGGLTAYSSQGGVSGKSIYIRYVAMSGPATDIGFCNAAQSGSLTTFRALDLSLSNARGGVTLKR